MRWVNIGGIGKLPRLANVKMGIFHSLSGSGSFEKTTNIIGSNKLYRIRPSLRFKSMAKLGKRSYLCSYLTTRPGGRHRTGGTTKNMPRLLDELD